MMRRLIFLLPLFATTLGYAQLTSENNERLRQGLKKYPAADADKDGILTLEEARAYLAKNKKSEVVKPKRGSPRPDFAEVAYGEHERNRLDLYLAKGMQGPTPVVVLIHGGGFNHGDKSEWVNDKALQELLSQGVSCAAINYPFIEHMPIQDILHHCARSVQFLRSKADEWNLDKTRFAAMGESAGAGTSLWLATRDDLADRRSKDPVLRESSRLVCAVCNAPQATYDISRWEAFLGPSKPKYSTQGTEAAMFYHLASTQDFLTETGKAILRECDMLSWITKDDPPLLLGNSIVVKAPRNRGQWLHCIQHAREIRKKCEEGNVSCIVLQDQPEIKTDAAQFLLVNLFPSM
ncbi:Alpha/beta hydrolase family protein [Prosthecobacter debontii]|uniref:Alpha/beta hydrolase family protein n=1 Tax=Prosthecobacter debontii TaxID=48467 RepID=A0A1T4YHA5_9BACT|nr:alpha/beta hydrolase [Prosthecobacter debontii]SKB00948.1 Alpha/beta hydrolase family protein [Prosthecobacter debontii]